MPLLRNGGPVRVALPPRATPSGTCELCPIGIGEDHRHLLHLVERRIVCVCETCWSTRSGDPEFRPPGSRTLVLDDFDMTDEVWQSFGIPIGLTFLCARVSAAGSSPSTRARRVRPSPSSTSAPGTRCARPTRSSTASSPTPRPSWSTARARRVYAIVPVDQAYKLVGLVKERWEGISGGRGVQEAVAEYFEALV